MYLISMHYALYTYYVQSVQIFCMMYSHFFLASIPFHFVLNDSEPPLHNAKRVHKVFNINMTMRHIT